jgi:CheY-like chemotaxis protein
MSGPSSVAQNAMPKSILVVDDSDTVRKLTRLFLESQIELEVCGEAVDGVDAIEKAKELKPDLIVLDLAMPRMNGVEAASALKRYDATGADSHIYNIFSNNFIFIILNGPHRDFTRGCVDRCI